MVMSPLGQIRNCLLILISHLMGGRAPHDPTMRMQANTSLFHLMLNVLPNVAAPTSKSVYEILDESQGCWGEGLQVVKNTLHPSAAFPRVQSSTGLVSSIDLIERTPSFQRVFTRQIIK